MKRLFQVILVIVILLLITIHQAISANPKHTYLPYKTIKVGFKHKLPLGSSSATNAQVGKKQERSAELYKNWKLNLEKQPDIVKEYITKRSRSTNWC